MNNKEYEIYKKISFVERYEKLSANFQYEERLDYSNEEVLDLIQNIGYKVKYIKKNNFFQLIEKKNHIKFYLHICLKYSNVELIIGATNTITEQFITGSVFSGLHQDIKYFEGTNLDNLLKKPKFRNYQDLEEILKEAFSIYEDFKNEVLKMEWE